VLSEAVKSADVSPRRRASIFFDAKIVGLQMDSRFHRNDGVALRPILP
jgi:hypothetical protein